MTAWMYLLGLRSGAIYVGASRDLPSRMKSHFSGTACRTTALDPPIRLLYSEEFPTFGQARKRENQLKRWSRAKKEALIRGDVRALKALARRRLP